jgi:2-keto-3-deoxy-L-arabinonate dehydratase
MPNRPEAWKGVFPILLTTFDDAGRLDISSQLRLADYLIESGAHGLALFGNASEGYTLSGAERVELMRKILPHINGRVPVIVSSGHTGTDCAADLSREAQDLGADGLMVLPPYYVKPDGEGVIRYYSAISDAVQIPIMVQDAPLLTQVAMPPSLLARMAKEIANIRYVKVEAPPTAPKVSSVRQAADEDLVIFGGLNGQFLLEEFRRGARGTMPGSDLIPEFVAIWNAYESGDHQNALTLFTSALPLIRFELQPALGVAAMKQNLKRAGIIASAAVRHPTRELDREGMTELADLRDALQQRNDRSER